MKLYLACDGSRLEDQDGPVSPEALRAQDLLAAFAQVESDSSYLADQSGVCSFSIEASRLHDLNVVREQSEELTGAVLNVGVGHDIEEARAALRVAKAKKDGQVVLFSPEIGVEAAALEAAPIRKSETLAKEMFGTHPQMRPFHGIISPKGEFHQMADKETHSAALSRISGKRQPLDMAHSTFVGNHHDQGYITVGRGGTPTIGINSELLKQPTHPAMKALRERIRMLPPDVQDIELWFGPENYRSVKREAAEKGNFNPPTITSMFRSEEPPAQTRPPTQMHPDEVHELFHNNVAMAQRSLPEQAMVNFQHHYSGGVLPFVMEHIGDLTHRMSEHIRHMEGSHATVSDKVNKTLRVLTQPYGFKKEAEENLLSNATYRVQNPNVDAFRAKADELQRIYAEEHRKLPVYNEVQKLGRDAAVAIGEKRYPDAIKHLTTLKQYLAEGKDSWKERTGRVEWDEEPKELTAKSEGLVKAKKAFIKRELDPKENITISHHLVPAGDVNYLFVKAHHGSGRVGKAVLHIPRYDKASLHPMHIEVDPAYRRKGIASAMYAYAEKLMGRTVRPGKSQTSLGQKLWEGQEKEGLFGKSEGLVKFDPSLHEGFWHGTPSGDLKGSPSGLHVGTREAAKEALEARIGTPVEGEWDGTREYGKTLLAGRKTLAQRGIYPVGYAGHSAFLDEDHYPTIGNAKFSDGSVVMPTHKPHIFQVKIVGPMTNTPDTPRGDAQANGLMYRQIKSGKARRGFYYRNDSENEGSISAVVPSGSHIERIDMKKAEEDLAKARTALPIGTIRNWAGTDYIKHHDGWVVYSPGRHQGKLMGKFKEDPQPHHAEFVTLHGKTRQDTGEAPAKEPAKEPEAKPTSTPKQEEEKPKALDPSFVADPKEPVSGKDFEEDPEDKTPREQAEIETKEQREDYVNARKSKFTNKGEDIKSSARHKAAEWKGLKHFEEAGTADINIKRDKLLDLNPPDLANRVRIDNYLSVLAMQMALEKMPSAPTSAYLKGEDTANDSKVSYYVVDNLAHKPTKMRPWMFESLKQKGQLPGEVLETFTVGDVKKRARQEYVEMYEHLKKLAEDHAARPGPGHDFFGALTAFRTDVILYLRERRAKDPHDDVANALVPYVNRTLDPSRYTSVRKNSVMHSLMEFAVAAQKHYGKEDAKDLYYQNPQVKQDIIEILNGKNYKRLYGVEEPKGLGTGQKRKSIADFYLGEVKREGSLVEFKTVEEQENFLLKSGKIRGLQWGNSVTDSEREHHLKMSAEAMKDLVDILGLPEAMVSFNGRLGLAIGARGHGKALAHYEPSLVVINLTRAGGAGSLAHEWGHFWDNTIAKAQKGGIGRGYLSEVGSYYARRLMSPIETQPEPTTTVGAMSALMAGEGWKSFDAKVRDYIRKNPELFRTGAGGFGMKGPSYWLESKEMFARAFETYIQYKLKQAGKTNTYLSGVAGGELWPVEEDVAKMAPAFDKMFEIFKNSEDLNKALKILQEEQPMRKDDQEVDYQIDPELNEPQDDQEIPEESMDLRARIEAAIRQGQMGHNDQMPPDQADVREDPGIPGDPDVAGNPGEMPPTAADEPSSENPEQDQEVAADPDQPGPPDASTDQEAPAPDAEAPVLDQADIPPDAEQPAEGEGQDEEAPVDGQEQPEEAPAEDQAGDAKARLRNLIGGALAQIHEAAPKLEAMKQQDPEVYGAVLEVVQALIAVTETVTGGQSEQEEAPPIENAPAQEAPEGEAPADEEDAPTEEMVSKSEGDDWKEKALPAYPNVDIDKPEVKARMERDFKPKDHDEKAQWHSERSVHAGMFADGNSDGAKKATKIRDWHAKASRWHTEQAALKRKKK